MESDSALDQTARRREGRLTLSRSLAGSRQPVEGPPLRVADRGDEDAIAETFERDDVREPLKDKSADEGACAGEPSPARRRIPRLSDPISADETSGDELVAQALAAVLVSERGAAKFSAGVSV